MKAKDIALPEFLNGPKQFLVPIFQRDYSWGLKHCEQLWNDVERIGNDPKAHIVFRQLSVDNRLWGNHRKVFTQLRQAVR